ncbi:hypothetical protein FB45DRAFT_869378 [Roridomyces roridus]|uniref:Uncharacterized protein n=1 Tax=Roridomyces roridus TaxID=1738132 RepID=A0AAD7BLP4_9AGAR|nr:hypothetical protein FB45DRAFT_869378 [Roridomyces roridus]
MGVSEDTPRTDSNLAATHSGVRMMQAAGILCAMTQDSERLLMLTDGVDCKGWRGRWAKSGGRGDVLLGRAPTRPLTAPAVALTAVMGGRTGPTRPSDHVARPQNGRVVPVRPVTAVMTVKITDWYSASLRSAVSGRLPMTQLAEDPSPPVMTRRRPGTGTPSAKEPDPDPAVKIVASEGWSPEEALDVRWVWLGQRQRDGGEEKNVVEQKRKVKITPSPFLKPSENQVSPGLTKSSCGIGRARTVSDLYK